MSQLTHDATCTDCGTLFACANPHEPEMHERRRFRGWDDRCPSCERKAQQNWHRWLNSSPETRTFDPGPPFSDGTSTEAREYGLKEYPHGEPKPRRHHK